MSRPSSLTRCFCRMITTSDAVQVAAATSSSSTGDVAAFELPSTRIGGRPVPFPSNCSSRSQRIVTSAVGAMLVAPSRREADEQAVPAHPFHAMVLEEPVEGRAVVQLETEWRVDPEPGAPGIGAASIATGHAEAQSDVRRRDLFVVGESPQRLETPDIGIGPIAQTELRGGAEPETIREQIADVQRGPQHELARAAEVHAAAHAESEQSEARATVLGVLRRLELLCLHVVHGGQAQRHERHQDNSHAAPVLIIACVARLIARSAPFCEPYGRSSKLRTLQWPRWPTRGDECRSNRRWPPPV